MSSLAERIEPPFYAAILNDNTDQRLEDENHLAPSDEMISIAPAQPGFLGLETTEDKCGTPVAVSYWRDMDALKAWEHRGDMEIRKRFAGAGLEETCAIRISKIDEKLAEPNHLRAEHPAIPTSSTLNMLSTGLIAVFPALAGFLGYEQIV